jgi:hypothetical protein
MGCKDEIIEEVLVKIVCSAEALTTGVAVERVGTDAKRALARSTHLQ